MKTNTIKIMTIQYRDALQIKNIYKRKVNSDKNDITISEKDKAYNLERYIDLSMKFRSLKDIFKDICKSENVKYGEIKKALKKIHKEEERKYRYY